MDPGKAVFRAVRNVLQKHLKVSSRALRLFLQDISIVASGIRTAYLIDAFDISPQMLKDILACIQETLKVPNDKRWEEIAILYDALSGQSYIAHKSLLKSRIELEVKAQSPNQWTLYCKLSLPHPQIIEIPSELRDVLCVLKDNLELSSNSNSVISIPTSAYREQEWNLNVVLAGFLLEYPISYIPSSLNPSALNHVPLCVCECTIQSPQRDYRSTLIKFSFPANLEAEIDNIGAGHIWDRLEERFAPRLEQTEWHDLRIHYSRMIFDAVVL